MEQRSLGTSGLDVSRIALGSWRTYERMDRRDAETLLAHALAHGVSFLDDARYDDETGNLPMATGYSEVLFGELFRAVGADRDGVVVANKLWWEFWPEQDALGELEASLARMGFERIDLLYSSTLPESVAVEVCVEQMARVLTDGRVRAWGVVNWSSGHIAAAVRECASVGIAAPCAAQLSYSLARTDLVENAAMEAALDAAGAALVPSYVLRGGALSGKYAHGMPAGRLRDARDDPRAVEALRIGDALAPVAAGLNTTPAALAVAFTLTHPRTAATLVGATTPAQLDEALTAVDVVDRLNTDVLEQLRRL